MKKLLILSLCLAMCFLSACMPESTETMSGTTTLDTSSDSIPQADNTGANNNSCAPPCIEFETIDFLKQVLIAADGSEEDFDAFLNRSAPWSLTNSVTQTGMKNIKEKLLISAIPYVKKDIIVESTDCIYYGVGRFYISYYIDDILYCFSYLFDPSQYTPSNGEKVIEDYRVGPYTMDLYANGGAWYRGAVTLDNAILVFQFRSETPPPDSIDLFEFKPLDLSTPTE